MDGAVLPVCLTWDQTMVEVMKIMATSFKRSHACTAARVPPTLQQATTQPRLQPETPGHSRASLGQSLVRSLLLSPGSWCTKVSVCALQESVSPDCVNSGSSMVGLMVTSSKRAYAIPRSTPPRTSAPEAAHCWPVPLKRHSTQFCLSLYGVSESWCAQGIFEPSECLWQVWGLILNAVSPLLPFCWGFSLPLDMWYLLKVTSAPRSHCSSTT